MAKKISQLTQATEVKSDDVTVIVQDGETKKLPLNMMVTKQDIENKKVAGLAKLDEIETTYENDTYTPTIAVKNKSSVKVGEGDGVDYSANVMDGHVKSAILKGKTLVNTVKGNVRVSNKGMNVVSVIPTDKSKKYLLKFRVNKVATVLKESATQMAVKLQFFSGGNPKGYHYISNENFNVGFEETIVVEPLVSGDEANFIIWIPRYESGELDIDILFIEYQDGMENWDIPYFEGMQSVKMPVLTTVGANLLNPKKFVGYKSVVKSADGVIIDVLATSGSGAMRPVYDEIDLPLDTYIITCEIVNGVYNGGNLCIYNENYTNIREFSFKSGKGSATVTSKIKALRLWSPWGTDNCQIRITIRTDGSTTYEPYKSNILTVNEPIELRGIGDVQDTINCLNGEATERIGEMVIDGSENWNKSSKYMYGYTFPHTLSKSNSPLKSNNYPIISAWGDGTKNGIFKGGAAIAIVNTNINSLTELKEWLSENPITIQYELNTESVKTVDLMPSGTHPSTTPYCWKNGHIQLSSSGLLPNLEYSVVTSRAGQINQNATMIVKNDKRIFDLEILLAGGLVNTTYQALTLQNQVETGLSKVSLSSEKEPDYLLYHMIMKLIEEKAYKLDDLAEKVSVFYLYEKLSDEQFETIYAALYPFVEDEYDELSEEAENEVVM